MSAQPKKAPGHPASPPAPVVRAMPFEGDDRALLDALQRKQPPAIAAFCQRYGDHVKRVLGRILGADSELPDLHHDVFIRAIQRAHTLDRADNLRGWLSVVAVNRARDVLRARKRWRWLPLTTADSRRTRRADHDAAEALTRLYHLLDRMPADERIVFTLRLVDGMPLAELADACDVSLATAKRRLKKAGERFSKLARRDELLREWLEEGDRWD